MFKKILVLVVVLMLGMSIVASAEKSESKFVEEFKQWEFSLGGYAYLMKAKSSYYSVGVKRDLGQFFNGLDKERLYGEAGYLNSKVFGNEAEKIGKKEYWFAGLSTNANFLVQQGIKGINELVNGNFKTPEIMDKILATVGVISAKKIDEDLYQVWKGWDYGINIAIIRQW